MNEVSTAEEAHPRNHALIIGFSEFNHFDDLPNVESTTRAWKRMLAISRGRSRVFDEIHGPWLNLEPVKVNERLVDFLNKLALGDRLVVFLVGHGAIIGDEKRPLLALPSREADPNNFIDEHWLKVPAIIARLE